MIGTQIHPYRILEKIGEGGMGMVYKAIHMLLDQEVAIKVPSPEYAQDPAMRERFMTAARIQAQFSHPHVVNVLNYLEDAGNIFLVMEYVGGGTLEQRLATKGSIPQQEAVSICQAVLAALSFMHSKGILHRDIKPGNIMFTDTGVVKVTDFGIAKVVGEKGQTQTGMRLGTLWYMAPEQLQGRAASVASDIYALGITLYEMATGRLPFQGDSEYTVMKGHIEEVPEPPWMINQHVSHALGHVILKALEKQPEQRYHSADDFATGLAGISQQSSAAGGMTLSPAPLPSSRSRFARCKPWQYRTMCVGVGLIVALVVYVVFFYGTVPSIPGGSPPSPLAEHPTQRVSAAVSPSAPQSTPAPQEQRVDESPQVALPLSASSSPLQAAGRVGEQSLRSQSVREVVDDLVTRLLQPIAAVSGIPHPRVLVQRLTYRDLTLESNGTQFFSGLINVALRAQGWVEVVESMADAVPPYRLVRGEVWDAPDEITVRLRLIDGTTSHEFRVVEARINRETMPPDITFTPATKVGVEVTTSEEHPSEEGIRVAPPQGEQLPEGPSQGTSHRLPAIAPASSPKASRNSEGWRIRK